MRLFGTIVSYLDAGRILASGRLDRTNPVARIIGSVTSFTARLRRVVHTTSRLRDMDPLDWFMRGRNVFQKLKIIRKIVGRKNYHSLRLYIGE